MVQLLLFIKFVTSNPIFVLRPILKTNNSFKDQKLFYDLKTTKQSDVVVLEVAMHRFAHPTFNGNIMWRLVCVLILTSTQSLEGSSGN